MGWNGPSCENQAQGKLDLNLTQRNLEIHPKGDGGFSCLHQNYSSLGLVCNEQWRFCHNCVISRNMICIINDVKQKLIQHPPCFFKHRSRERQMLAMIYNQVVLYFCFQKKRKKLILKISIVNMILPSFQNVTFIHLHFETSLNFVSKLHSWELFKLFMLFWIVCVEWEYNKSQLFLKMYILRIL